MERLNWNVTEEKVIKNLEELSTFHRNKEIDEEFQELISPHDMFFPVINSEGNCKKKISVEFSLPFNGAINWKDIKSRQSQIATNKSLHPLLLRFVRGADQRAIYVKKIGKNFKIELFEDISIESSFRYGYSELYDAVDIYKQPYQVPKVQDILNKAGFHFLGHYRFDYAILCGNEPNVTVFGIRTALEKYVLYEKDREGILSMLPCYDREKKEIDYNFMDFYIR